MIVFRDEHLFTSSHPTCFTSIQLAPDLSLAEIPPDPAMPALVTHALPAGRGKSTCPPQNRRQQPHTADSILRKGVGQTSTDRHTRSTGRDMPPKNGTRSNTRVACNRCRDARGKVTPPCSIVTTPTSSPSLADHVDSSAMVRGHCARGASHATWLVPTRPSPTQTQGEPLSGAGNKSTSSS